MNDNLLTFGEAADLLGITTSRLGQLVNEGRIGTIRQGRRFYVWRSHVQNYRDTSDKRILSLSEACDWIDRAVDAEKDPSIQAFYAKQTGSSDPIPPGWLGSLHNRLHLIDAPLLKMGESVTINGAEPDFRAYLHDAWWDRIPPFLLENGLHNDTDYALHHHPTSKAKSGAKGFWGRRILKPAPFWEATRLTLLNSSEKGDVWYGGYRRQAPIATNLTQLTNDQLFEMYCPTCERAAGYCAVSGGLGHSGEWISARAMLELREPFRDTFVQTIGNVDSKLPYMLNIHRQIASHPYIKTIGKLIRKSAGVQHFGLTRLDHVASLIEKSNRILAARKRIPM
jgi:excisionase family DNA binding protein